MIRIWELLFAMGLVAILTALCVTTQGSVIEGDLRLRAMSALRNQGLDDLQIEMQGRDLTLTGVLFAQEDRDRALELVRVHGVRTVDDRLRIVEEHDLWLRIQVDDEGDVTLRGWVDDEQGMQTLHRAVEGWYRSGRVDDRTRVAELPEPTSLLEAAWFALPWLAELSPGLLEITSERLLLAGRTARSQVAEKARLSLAASVDGPVAIEIRRSEPSPETEFVGQQGSLDAEVESTDSIADSTENLSLDVCRSRLEALLSAEDLAFEKWSPRLAVSSTVPLGGMAAVLEGCSEEEIRITGLADRESRENVDLILGRERARSVKVWLMALGVEADRMQIAGSGRGARRAGSRVIEAIEIELGGLAP